MKCFGEFEMDTFQIKFLEFLIYEIFDSMELNSLAFSLTKYWIHTVKNNDKRNEIIEKTKKLIANKIKT